VDVGAGVEEDIFVGVGEVGFKVGLDVGVGVDESSCVGFGERDEAPLDIGDIGTGLTLMR